MQGVATCVPGKTFEPRSQRPNRKGHRSSFISFKAARSEEGGKENNGGNDQRDVRRLGRDGRDGRDGHDDDDARKTMKGEGECVACPKKVARRRRFSSGRAK